MVDVNPGLPVFFCASLSVLVVRVESGRFTQCGFIVSATGETFGIRQKSFCGQQGAFILIVDPVSASKVRRSIPKISRASIHDWLKELKRWTFLITNVSPYSCCLFLKCEIVVSITGFLAVSFRSTHLVRDEFQ